jgi:hypothetical protein
MTAPRFPSVKIKLAGQPTGKLPIVIRTTAALRKAGIAEREIDLYQKEALAGDFDNCLAVTLAWVGLL